MKKIFKGDYFYFSRSDRVATFILLIIIIVVNVIRVKIERPLPTDLPAAADSMFVSSDTLPKRAVYATAKSSEREKQRNYSSYKRGDYSKYNAESKYRKMAADTIKPVKKNEDTARLSFPVYKRKKTPLSATDLNIADSAFLTTLPGIGPYYASRIVEYRELLGGYVDVLQLKEIDGIQDSVLRWFVVTDTVQIRRVNINELSLSKLRNHPYINFYQAKAITEYRYTEGDIKSTAPLSFMEEFTEQDILRLEPYLNFE